MTPSDPASAGPINSATGVARATAGMGRTAGVLAGLVVVLAVVALLRLCVGQASLGWPTIESGALEDRGMALIAAVLIGVALSTSGVSLQVLLRNPLAEPFILGLSTGAGLGVMVQMWLAHSRQHYYGSNSFGAVIGAGAAMLIVFGASRRRGVIDPLGLLLVGVVLSTICGAMIMVIQYLVGGEGGLNAELSRWMMGYINQSNLTTRTLWMVGVTTFAGLAVAMSLGRAMDVATFSDAEAESLGVNLARLRVLLFAVAGVLAAVSVVLAGPIAFVGLVCPHLARLLLGPGHLALLLGAAVIGAILVVLADMAGNALALRLNVGVMPIGIFTAILGGPAFLWMLRPQLGRGSE